MYLAIRSVLDAEPVLSGVGSTDVVTDKVTVATEEAVEAPQPVVLAPTEIIVATLERNTVETVLSQQYEMQVSPLGTQVFMLHNGQRILSFTTDVQLSSLDGMRHDGMNFVI